MLLGKKHGLMESRRVHMVKTDEIRRNPYQPRSVFDEEGLNELSESIRQYGVLQPLTIRRSELGGYELVAGERRLRASKLAGLRDVPCILLDATEKQSGVLALVENLQRCDLDFFEEAEGIRRLIRQFGLSQDEAARRLGKSQSAIANKLRLLRHPDEVTAAIRRHGLTERHARALLRIEGLEARLEAVEHIAQGKLNVAQTEEYIERLLAGAAGESEAKRGIRTLYVFKDIRLFLNTVTRAVETMRRSGVNASLDKEEEDGDIRLTIVIPGTR
ncbi:MAG: ParB/RepB/Spo0J family partition protein [Oscillospiraceae bacterium]|jgi:ParB family chromosome partitioning protein|nr:ParB/RepB/Spo0J family partition protein [Oscillospiraceae bacterium]